MGENMDPENLMSPETISALTERVIGAGTSVLLAAAANGDAHAVEATRALAR